MMYWYINLVVLVALPGIFAQPGHEHHQPHHVNITDCYSIQCGDHTPFCQIKQGHHEHIEGHCVNKDDCIHSCTADTHLGHDGCCCKNDACVATFKQGQTGSSTTVSCPECDNYVLNHCTHQRKLCHDEESCLIRSIHGRKETYCAPKHECEEHHGGHGPHHDDVHVCCHSDACVDKTLHISHGTTAAATSTGNPIQNVQTSAQAGTTAPPKTAMPTTSKPDTQTMAGTTQSSIPIVQCSNTDQTGYCSANAQTICASTDYHTHIHAVLTCASTCNFCVEYQVMMQQNGGAKSTTAAPMVTGASGIPAVTTVNTDTNPTTDDSIIV